MNKPTTEELLNPWLSKDLRCPPYVQTLEAADNRGATRALALADDDVRVRAHRHLEDVIIALTDGGCDSLARYNDVPGRTQAEILAVFDAAIKLADPTS